MQVGAMAKREGFEEDYGAVDIMSSLERDIGNLFHCIELNLLCLLHVSWSYMPIISPRNSPIKIYIFQHYKWVTPLYSNM